MFRRLGLLFTNPELRTKILQIIGILIFARLLTHVPMPGIEVKNLSDLINNNSVFQLLNLISGGGYGSLSFVMLGVSPYITASIVFQLLGVIVPKIQQIQKEEGEQGRAKINRWTRWLTYPLAMLSAWGILRYLDTEKLLPESFYGSSAAQTWVIAIMCLAAGSVVMMWLGEIINEYKMGNGVSFLILAGIVSQVPRNIGQNWNNITTQLGDFFGVLSRHLDYIFNWQAYVNFFTDGRWFALRSSLVLLLTFVVTLLLVVFMNDAIRKLIVVYSRRGHAEGTSRTLHAVKADLPIKVNVAGVIPIIFSVSFILFPTVIATFLSSSSVSGISDAARNVQTYLSPNPARDTGTNQNVLEPESIKKDAFLGVYKLDTQEKLLTAKNYDPNEGGELGGFMINNFKRNCNAANDSAATEQDKQFAKDLNTNILGIPVPCNWRLSFLPEFGLYFHGFLAYNFIYFFLIIFFTYFYTANIAFKTDDVAENLQKSGAYIPGFQPGKQTENYLTYLTNRLNVVGAIFLAVIALFPILLSKYIQFDRSEGLASIVGGTTILILVSVAIETLRQLEAQITTVDYDSFVKGAIKTKRSTGSSFAK
jgi:preprotein translocase SecY subunit